MTQKYKTIITTEGRRKLAEALKPGGKKVTLAKMQVGDGNGQEVEPSEKQQQLVKKVWEGDISSITQDAENESFVTAELVIPADQGGFWVREIGLFDDEGAMIAVGNVAEGYKPRLEEGSGREQVFRMVILLSNISALNIKLDQSVVMVTKATLDQTVEELKSLIGDGATISDASTSQKGVVQLSSDTNSDSETAAATPKAVKATMQKATELEQQLESTSQELQQLQEQVQGSAQQAKYTQLTVDLDTLWEPEKHGDYYQDKDNSATTESHYPVNKAGTLAVKMGAWGCCQQEYTAWNPPQKFIRTVTGKNDNTVTWSEWVEVGSGSIRDFSEMFPIGSYVLGSLIDDGDMVRRAGFETSGSNLYVTSAPINSYSTMDEWRFDNKDERYAYKRETARLTGTWRILGPANYEGRGTSEHHIAVLCQRIA
ncbi:phage tail protein [Escherichia coli]|nr:hypothetical protein [Escherichia coli]EHL6436749.1 phage tail protein [Escherichia coli]